MEYFKHRMLRFIKIWLVLVCYDIIGRISTLFMLISYHPIIVRLVLNQVGNMKLRLGWLNLVTKRDQIINRKLMDLLRRSLMELMVNSSSLEIRVELERQGHQQSGQWTRW